MSEERTPEERALVRAAAEELAGEDLDPTDYSWRRDYRTMGRGTVAALDWVEGLTDVAPCTGVVARPDDLVTARTGFPAQAIDIEIGRAEEWGAGHVRPPHEDMHFFGAVWALLRWWDAPGDSNRTLAIHVEGLAV